MSALRIVVAPSGFKESLSPDEAAAAIAAGVRRAAPQAEIIEIPLVDGGEGFTEGLVRATGGTLHQLQVTGPIGQPVDSQLGVLGGEGPRTYVLEMAAAAGLRLVPKEHRDPLLTTTYGVGELMRAALDHGPSASWWGAATRERTTVGRAWRKPWVCGFSRTMVNRLSAVPQR